jgi:5S rRNA maturation endonuclease (ribonuclease M5)
MHIKDKVEKVEKVIARLVDESAKGIPIIVEGKKDAQTLREFGVTGTIVTVKTGGKSYLETVEDIGRVTPRQVILLLDFDRRGREGTMFLQLSLERVQIEVNRNIWLELKALTGHEMQCIESLFSYLQTLREKT